jgi:hypothetical protein
MAYIGSPPSTQSFAPGTDTFSGTGSQTAFTLSRNVATVNDILVVVNNVDQQPTAYTVASNILTFSAAPSSGTNNIYVRYLTTNLTAITPNPKTVGLPEFSATGTPSASTYLRGDNTWSTVSTGTVAVASGGTGQTSYTDGQLLIGNSTGNTLTKTTLTAGANVTITNGAGAITIAASGGGGGGFSSWQVFTSNGTFTVPAGITKVKVTVTGGGGGGGGNGGSAGYVGGGGGGGTAIEIISGLTPGGTVAVTVGVGGTAGSSTGGTSGGTGGTSSFGAYCSATGGAGGSGNGAPAPIGTGGIGSGGDLNIRGGYGGAFGISIGGNSFFGGVGNSPFTGGSVAGAAYGGGAGGAYSPGCCGANGSAGAAGVVIVEY